jgi:hypothetical protein
MTSTHQNNLKTQIIFVFKNAFKTQKQIGLDRELDQYIHDKIFFHCLFVNLNHG